MHADNQPWKYLDDLALLRTALAIVSGTILAWKLLTVSGRNFQAF
jgi:hypothetical protein